MKNLSPWRGIAALFLLFLLFMFALTTANGCGAFRFQPTLEDHRQAVVKIVRGDSAFGSGFVIDDRGYILTNHHVVGDARTVTVRFSDGRKAKGTVMWTSAKGENGNPKFGTDIALVKVDAPVTSVARLRCSGTKIGEKVAVIGHPNGADWTISWGRVSAIRAHTVQVDASIIPGNSGGPIFGEDGKVIGMSVSVSVMPIGAMPFSGPVRQILPSLGFAVPAKTICAFLVR